MNVNLDYASGQSYSQYFDNFGIKVSGGGERRIKVAFREKTTAGPALRFSCQKKRQNSFPMQSWLLPRQVLTAN
jgi:hypothetical protein